MGSARTVSTWIGALISYPYFVGLLIHRLGLLFVRIRVLRCLGELGVKNIERTRAFAFVHAGWGGGAGAAGAGGFVGRRWMKLVWSGCRGWYGSGCWGCLSGAGYRAGRRLRQCRGRGTVAVFLCMRACGSQQKWSLH